MNMLTVTFFGHRYIDNIAYVESLLKKHIQELLTNNQYVKFLVGRNGDFDQCVSSSILRVRRHINDNNSSFVLILPYPTAEYLNNKDYFGEYYDEIEISQKASRTHPKSALKTRNCEMIDRSDIILCYVKENKGGAYQAVQYAKKQGKVIINLA